MEKGTFQLHVFIDNVIDNDYSTLITTWLNSINDSTSLSSQSRALALIVQMKHQFHALFTVPQAREKSK